MLSNGASSIRIPAASTEASDQVGVEESLSRVALTLRVLSSRRRETVTLAVQQVNRRLACAA
jgi:hypothetical protein